MILSIISWILIGLIVGLIARLLVPGPQHIGILPTIGLGIVGSLIGGLVSWIFTGAQSAYSSHAWPGWILAVIGAVIVLWLFANRRAVRS